MGKNDLLFSERINQTERKYKQLNPETSALFIPEFK